MPDDKTYVDRVIRIAELAAGEPNWTLHGFHWIRCAIQGPAVIVLSGGRFLRCRYDGPSADALVWEIPESRTAVIGAVSVVDCTFEDCSFTAIGFAGHPALARQHRRMVQGGTSS